MSAVARIERLDPPPALHPTLWRWPASAAAALAAAVFCALWLADAPRAWSGLLIGLTVLVWLGVGSLFFLAAHALGGARWTVPLQGVMHGIGAGWPLALLGFAAIAAFGIPSLYDWSLANPERGALFRDPAGSKAWWMQDGRWALSTLALLALLWLCWTRWQRCAIIDSPEAQRRQARWAVVTLLVLVPGFTWLSWDTLLALHVQWVSAVWGALCLTSAVHLFLGCSALALAWLGQHGLAQVSRPHLRHDLGTWMMAWSAVVAYLAAAQYTIIGFANIDEESFWYLLRLQHGYGALAAAELVLRCALPFLVLLSPRLRAASWAQVVAGLAIVLGTWLHLHLIVVPAFAPNHFRSPLAPESLIALGCLAGGFLLALRCWRRCGLVPLGDPRLIPAINGDHR
ncbi:MAG: hypothetical protein N3B15_04800 [Planctomycetota bacterium]|nr:hypothetical protein [Planctomycetota bacterium]